MSERPPLKDVIRVVNVRGMRGGHQVALVLSCGHWITRRRVPALLGRSFGCIGCLVEKAMLETPP